MNSHTFLFALSISPKCSESPSEKDAFFFKTDPKTSSFPLPFAFPGSGGTLKIWSSKEAILSDLDGSLAGPVNFCFLVIGPPGAETPLLELAVRLRSLDRFPAPTLFVRPNVTGGFRGVGSSGRGIRLMGCFGGGRGVRRATRNLTVLGAVT